MALGRSFIRTRSRWTDRRQIRLRPVCHAGAGIPRPAAACRRTAGQHRQLPEWRIAPCADQCAGRRLVFRTPRRAAPAGFAEHAANP